MGEKKKRADPTKTTKKVEQNNKLTAIKGIFFVESDRNIEEDKWRRRNGSIKDGLLGGEWWVMDIVLICGPPLWRPSNYVIELTPGGLKNQQRPGLSQV